VLWIWIAVAMSAHGLLGFMEPGGLEKIAEMEMGPWMLFGAALFWMIPLVMAFLTVTLKDSASCLVNMVMGGIGAPIAIIHWVRGLKVYPTAHHGLIVISTVVAMGLIFVYASKWWHKEEL